MISTYIRTHDQRVQLAFQLYEHIILEKLGDDCRILNTGESSRDYSEKYIKLLDQQLAHEKNEYVLLLEDDILFTNKAISKLRDAVELELPYVWFSIPHLELLKNAEPLCRGFVVSTIVNNLYYSGSILVRADVLRDFVCEYLQNVKSLQILNIDVNLSLFLIKLFGHHMILCPSVFGTDPNLESSISNNSEIKSEYRFEGQALCDPHFDVTQATFRYSKNIHIEKHS